MDNGSRGFSGFHAFKEGIGGMRKSLNVSMAAAPLGLAVVGGLLFSQFLTLFVTPVFYLYMDRFQGGILHLFGRRGRGRPAAPAA